MTHKNLPLPAQSRLLYLLSYCPKTGVLCRRVATLGTSKTGEIPRKPDGSYGQVMVDGVRYLAHRLIWRMQTGEDPGEMTVDHIDRDRSNSRWSNFRLATQAEQVRNSGLRRTNSSGAASVFWHSRREKWGVHLREEAGGRRRQQYFSNKSEALRAAESNRRKIYGEFYPE